jgi:4'-phosphopantetheinyl transferase
MKFFLHSEWINYELGNPGPLAQAVHFWQIRPAHIFVQYLNPEESLRYEKIAHEEAKISYCSAQGGLRKIVSAYMDCLPEAVEMRRGRRGKPYVPGAPQFNLSHSEGMIMAAFSASPVGLDVESARRTVQAEGIARKFFFDDEIRRVERAEASMKSLTFLRYWVCKEAIVKLSGDGIYHGLRYAQVDLSADGRSQGAYKGRKVWLNELRPSQDLVAALASWRPLEAKGFFRI